MGPRVDEPEPGPSAHGGFEVVDISPLNGAGEPGPPPWSAQLWASLRAAPRTVQLGVFAWLAAAALAVVSPFLTYTSYSFPGGDGRPITFWYSGWGVITASQTDGVTINGHGPRYGIGLAVLAGLLILCIVAILRIVSAWPLTIAMIGGGALAALAWTVQVDAGSYAADDPGAKAGAGVVVAVFAGALGLIGSLAGATAVARATAKGR